MRKFIIILLTLALAVSLVACGGEKGKDTDISDTVTPTQTENSSSENTEATTPENTETVAPENTAAPENGPIAAKGETCTITVPKLETFIDGYEIVTAGCNDSTAIQTAYVKLYKEEPLIEINVSVEQLTISSAETEDAKGYADYCNSRNIGPYEPVDIAGYFGYLKSKFSDSSKVADNWYIIDYPLSDGTSMVISLYVGQKYADDTSAMTPIAEAFLKNIEVAPNND